MYYGNPTDFSVLAAAKTKDAKLVIVTLDDPKESLHAVMAIRYHYPKLPIAAHAYNLVHAAELEKSGAKIAIPETAEVSLQLGLASLLQLGLPDELADETVESYQRAVDRFVNVITI